MYIDFDKLNGKGYDVQSGKRGVSITPKSPIQLEWSAMENQFVDLGLSPFMIDMAKDAFHVELDMIQVMEACKG